MAAKMQLQVAQTSRRILGSNFARTLYLQHYTFRVS